MNLKVRMGDSGTIARGKIDKAVVIQNLFRCPSKSPGGQEIFLNYSLDTSLPPELRTTLEELVDDHLQEHENKG